MSTIPSIFMMITATILSYVKRKLFRKKSSVVPQSPSIKKAGLKLSGVAKLVPNLYHKKNYIVHYATLQQALLHGLKLKKVHRAISYTQEDWMKSYIMLNTELRKKAKNDFEKNFYKLMNNSVFGKNMENVRDRIDIEIVVDEKRYEKVINAPTFVRSNTF